MDDFRETNRDLDSYLEARRKETPLWDKVTTRARLKAYRTSVHTPTEILQQPWLWERTARLIADHMDSLAGLLENVGHLYLTGAGSSLYIGKCLEAFLHARLGIPVRAVGTTDLILDPDAFVAPGERNLVVSFSRAGSSPESFEAARVVRETFPEFGQFLITCNSKGGLARMFEEMPEASVLAMHPASCDRGLAMTGSFTTMLVAAQSLGFLGRPQEYLEHVAYLSESAAAVLDASVAILEDIELEGILRVCLLGNGGLQGAAREGALKVLEMTDGQIATLAESFLGVRHGPLSFIDEATLVVYFLSSGSKRRKYEADLMREIDEKKLGRLRVALGSDLSQAGELFDHVIELPGSLQIPDDARAPLDVIFPQLLALYLSLELDLDPDNPSRRGTINRVVQGVTIHREEHR